MSIKELKQALLYSRCAFIQMDIPCQSKADEPCSECVNKLVDEFVAKVRADAIDEFANLVIECGMSNGYVDAESFIELAEQLKENKC